MLCIFTQARFNNEVKIPQYHNYHILLVLHSNLIPQIMKNELIDTIFTMIRPDEKKWQDF